MASRIPVIISAECHFSEVAELGAGYVVALNAEEIATALQSVLTNPAARRRMGEAGQRLVQSRYTWPKIAEQSIRAYEHAVAKSSP